MNFMTFHILGIIIPTDFHIFQRGRYTTNQQQFGRSFESNSLIVDKIAIVGIVVSVIALSRINMNRLDISCGSRVQTPEIG